MRYADSTPLDALNEASEAGFEALFPPGCVAIRGGPRLVVEVGAVVNRVMISWRGTEMEHEHSEAHRIDEVVFCRSGSGNVPGPADVDAFIHTTLEACFEGPHAGPNAL